MPVKSAAGVPLPLRSLKEALPCFFPTLYLKLRLLATPRGICTVPMPVSRASSLTLQSASFCPRTPNRFARSLPATAIPNPYPSLSTRSMTDRTFNVCYTFPVADVLRRRERLGLPLVFPAFFVLKNSTIPFSPAPLHAMPCVVDSQQLPRTWRMTTVRSLSQITPLASKPPPRLTAAIPLCCS